MPKAGLERAPTECIVTSDSPARAALKPLEREVRVEHAQPF